MTANTPCRWYHLWTLANFSSAKVLRKNASPPFRPTEYKSAHPMTDPTMVNSVYFTILEGSLMVNVISSTSLTSGNETNEESHIARNIKPKLP